MKKLSDSLESEDKNLEDEGVDLSIYFPKETREAVAKCWEDVVKKTGEEYGRLRKRNKDNFQREEAGSKGVDLFIEFPEDLRNAIAECATNYLSQDPHEYKGSH